jgi:hypothetical protein
MTKFACPNREANVSVKETSSPKRWHRDTSWDDLGVRHSKNSGVDYWSFQVGEPGKGGLPKVVRSVFAPGVTVAPHSHPTDYAEIILEGSEQVGRRWYRAGDIRIVKGGTVYGPLLSGPEGVTKLIIFAGSDASVLSPAAAVALT